jgi:hypothetical protein
MELFHMAATPAIKTELTVPGDILGPRPATILELTDTTLRVSSPSRLLPGTHVRFKLAGSIVCGEVLSCRQDSHQFKAHIRILDRDRESRQAAPVSVLDGLMRLNAQLVAWESAAPPRLGNHAE